MYTRCTYCGSIYRVDAEILRRAAGQVRCGICEGTFDALRLLSEDFPDAQDAAASQHPIGDLFGETPAPRARDEHALDGGTDDGIVAPAMPHDENPEDHADDLAGELDALEELVEELEDYGGDADEDYEDEESLGLDAQEDPDGPYGPEGTDDVDDAWLAAEPQGEDWWAEDDAGTPVQGDLIDQGYGDTDDAHELREGDALISADEDAEDADDADEDLDDELRDAAVLSADGEVPDEDALETEVEPPYLPPEEALAELHRRSRPRPALWISFSVVAAILLAVQWVHATRQDLVLHPTLGPRLVEVYALLGMDLHPDWDPQMLSVERTEMVSHPSQPGALFLSGVLSNDGTHALPLPILRLRMDNRWGDVLAARDFLPVEYLRSPRDPDARFTPGERVALGVEILDPDPEAVGFRVQVCLPLEGSELRCR